MKEVVKNAFIKSLPVMAGYIVLGIGFGILLKNAGYSFFVSLFNQCYWILGCVLGSVIGTVITFDTAGIEFSMTALFVTVFVEQWLSTKNHRPAIIGLICSVACLVAVALLHVWKRITLLSIIGGTICYMLMIRF